MHPLLLHNGRIVSTAEKTLSPGQVGFMNGWGVFSTLRVAGGVLFAWERHWARMNRDATLMHVPMPSDAAALERDLLTLVEANRAFEATLRVAIVRNRGGFFEGLGIERDFDTIAFTTGLHHWGSSVALAVEEQARHSNCRFAGTKITSWAQNLTWLERAKSEGCDEVVLLDEQGRVSECTSANIFAVMDDGVWTPPLSAGCLPGVTRAVILEELRVPGVQVRERHLALSDLYSARSVFITSTTRELLPVALIAGQALHRNDEVRERLQTAFSAFRSAYSQGKRMQPSPALAGGA